jgi:hypothetical protein
MSDIFDKLDKNVLDCIKMGLFTIFKEKGKNTHILISKTNAYFRLTDRGFASGPLEEAPEFSTLERVYLPVKPFDFKLGDK